MPNKSLATLVDAAPRNPSAAISDPVVVRPRKKAQTERALTFHERLVLERQMNDLLSMRRMFFEGNDLATIGEALGMSKSRVSRALRGHAYKAAHAKLGLESISIGQKAGPGRGGKKTRSV